MFAILFLVMTIVLIAGLVYLLTRFRKLVTYVYAPDNRKGKILSFIFAGIPLLGLTVWSIVRPYWGAIFTLHLIVFWLIFDLVALLIRVGLKKHFAEHYRAVIVVLITIAYMSVGYYLAHHVYETDYVIDTDKDVRPVRIAMIADCHVGATFDAEGFEGYLKRIEETKPDMILISGDFVDDDSNRADMVRCVEALGRTKTTYGVFYANGNHDKGYGNKRDFTYDDLISEFERNNVTVLEDAVYEADDFYIVGRMDEIYEERLEVRDLMEGLDNDKFTIVLDHRPDDYDPEIACSCDLVLSGHTHGGQLFPLGQFAVLFGINDQNYGISKRGNTTFIVTSGLGDWAIPYKTFCISEYCVIDVK